MLPLGSAAAYVPTAEEIFAQLALQAPAVSRAIFETRSVVLAPDLEAAARAAETRGGAEPEMIEIPERGFRQRFAELLFDWAAAHATEEDDQRRRGRQGAPPDLPAFAAAGATSRYGAGELLDTNVG